MRYLRPLLALVVLAVFSGALVLCVRPDQALAQALESTPPADGTGSSSEPLTTEPAAADTATEPAPSAEPTPATEPVYAEPAPATELTDGAVAPVAGPPPSATDPTLVPSPAANASLLPEYAVPPTDPVGGDPPAPLDNAVSPTDSAPSSATALAPVGDPAPADPAPAGQAPEPVSGFEDAEPPEAPTAVELLTSAVARAFADPPEMVAGLLEGFDKLAKALGGMFNGVDDSVAGGILDQVLADPSGVAAGLAGRVGEVVGELASALSGLLLGDGAPGSVYGPSAPPSIPTTPVAPPPPVVPVAPGGASTFVPSFSGSSGSSDDAPWLVHAVLAPSVVLLRGGKLLANAYREPLKPGSALRLAVERPG